MTSKYADFLDQKNAARGLRWGCRCKGWNQKGGVPLRCRGCELWFHAKCERLDDRGELRDELHRLAADGSFECTACESARLAEAGFGPEAGRFAYVCRECGRTFDDQEEAERHGRRCVAARQSRRWVCACGGGARGASGVCCQACGGWFHLACRRSRVAAWEEMSSSLCDGCNKAGAGGGGGGGGGAAAAAALAGAGASGAEGGGRSSLRAERAALNEREIAHLLAASESAPAEAGQGSEVRPGTLADGRVVVAPSRLGAAAGLGLFAGVDIRRGEPITTYDGPVLYKEQLPRGHDVSYVLRVPDSGGALIDGKPVADAIRSNAANPASDGFHYPPAGSEWWERGAGSMCNDPRAPPLYNARIAFRRPRGSRSAAELATRSAVLLATRDIASGEEVYFNYRSEKPFEHLRRERQLQELKRRHKEERFDAIRPVWMPNAPS